jgi:hypothetical protein
MQYSFNLKYCVPPEDLEFLKKVYPESVSRLFRNPKPLILLELQRNGGQCRTRTCDLLLVRQAL